MIESILSDRTALTFAGGLVGGAIGFAIWSAVQRYLPRPTLWLCVAVLAFVGARVLPNLMDKTPVIPPPDASNGAAQTRTANTDDPVTQSVLSPEDITLLATLKARDADFASLMSRQIGDNAQPANDVLQFAVTYGAAAAQAYVPYAADQAILDLTEVLAITIERLIARDPRACYGWLYGGYGFETFAFSAFYRAVGETLIDYQLAQYDALVKNAGEGIPSYDENAARVAISRANFAMMQAAGVSNTGFITGERAPNGPDEYEAACQARSTLLRSLLLEENSADAIRHLYRLNTGQ